MAKAKKEAAKENTKKKTAEEKKAAREKRDNELQDKYVKLNETEAGKDTTIVTEGMLIRKMGVQIRETVRVKGVATSVSSNFIPGAKIKTKKVNKFLVMDVEKPKKEKKEKKDKKGDK